MEFSRFLEAIFAARSLHFASAVATKAKLSVFIQNNVDFDGELEQNNLVSKSDLFVNKMNQKPTFGRGRFHFIHFLPLRIAE